MAQRIPSIPYIYGQNAEYLEAQLLAFKRSGQGLGDGVSDTRSHHFMDRSLRDVPEERLHEVAQYYSRLSCSR
jgi:cytochrome c553